MNANVLHHRRPGDLHFATRDGRRLFGKVAALEPFVTAHLAALLTLGVVVSIRWFLLLNLVEVPRFFLFLVPAFVAAWVGGVAPGIFHLVISGLVGWYWSTYAATSPEVGRELPLTFLGAYLMQGLTGVMIGQFLRRSHLRQQAERRQRVAIQTSLEANEKRYRSVIAASSAIIWTADRRGAFVEEQKSWQAYTGQTWEQMNGWGWANALHPSCRPHIELQWRRVLTHPEIYVTTGQIWSREHGEYRHFKARSVPLLDAEGKVTEWVGTVDDIHDQVKQAEALKEAKERAEAANRTKGQFMANMSHEIRTPLAAIVGFTDLLVDRHLDEESERHVMTIRRNAEILSNLVKEVLDVSKVDSGSLEVEPARCSLHALISEVSALVGFKAQEKGLELKVQTDASVPDRIVTDLTRLRQVLQTVVGNAIKFTDKGGVTVSIKAVRGKGGATLEFLIADTGIGLNDDEKTRLFQPFMQADESPSRRFGGMGLGLFLARRVANLLGGDLELVASRPGAGSTFRLTVAVSDVASLTAESASPAVRKGDLQGRTILLVEDAKDNQILVGRMLQGSGAIVDVANNGAEAVEKALARSYDVILMDVQMPKMNGLEATQLLRQKGMMRPIIALTAHAMKSDRDRCLEMGCNDYLSKPFETKALLEKITSQLSP